MVPVFNWVSDWFKGRSDIRNPEHVSHESSSASPRTDSDDTSKLKTEVTRSHHRSKPKHFPLHRSLSCSHLNKRARYRRKNVVNCRLSPKHIEQLRGLVQGNTSSDDVDDIMRMRPGYVNDKAAGHGRLQIAGNSMKDQIVPKFSEATSKIDCESPLFCDNEQPKIYIPKFLLSNEDEDRILIEVCDEFLKSQGLQVEDEVLERAESRFVANMHEDFAELSSEDVTHTLSVL